MEGMLLNPGQRIGFMHDDTLLASAILKRIPNDNDIFNIFMLILGCNVF